MVMHSKSMRTNSALSKPGGDGESPDIVRHLFRGQMSDMVR